MLDPKNGAGLLSSDPVPPIAADEPSISESIAYILGVVRRQIIVVLAFALLGAAFGGNFLLHAPPSYTATATLLINTRRIEIIQQPAVSDTLSMQTVGAVESEVEL